MSSLQPSGINTSEPAAIFFAAIAIEQIPARRVLLDRICGDDIKRRQFLLSLLETHEFIVRGLLRESTSDDDDLGDDLPQATSGIPLGILSPRRYSGSTGSLGPYEVIQVVDMGGMSVVVEAFDTYLNRIVAIKVLTPTLCRHRRARERFQREAQAAAAIDHEYVTKIFAVDQQNNTPYLVMEFILGRTLATRLQDGGCLPADEFQRIGGQIAQGLAAIHAKGLLHRDLKPENILLEAPQDTVRISDFGVARSIDDQGLTLTGELNGTPHFMSPEQAQGQAVDQRSDMFSFGVLLYAMAVGQSPFQAATPLASMKRVCDDVPQPIGELRPDLPQWLTDATSQLLAKSPEDRRLTAFQLADMFSDCGRPRIAFPSAGTRKRSKPLIALIGATVCLATLVGGLLFHLGQATDPMQSLMARLRMYGQGYVHVAVEVDDPQVEFCMRTSRGPVSEVGAFECWVPPGIYVLIAYKNGQEIGSQSLSMDAWSTQTVVVETSNRRNESDESVLMRVMSN